MDRSECNIKDPKLLFFNVCVDETVSIDKDVESIIICKLQGSKLTDFSAVFEPFKDKLASLGVIAASAIVKIQDGKLPMRLINIKEETVKLFKNTTVGFVYKYESEQCEQMRLINEYDRDIKLKENENEVSHIQSLFDQIDSNNQLTAVEKKECKELISEYKDCFAVNKQDIGHTTLAKHEIRLQRNAPIQRTYRKIPYGLEKQVDEEVNKLLEDGMIRESNSPWNSPLVMVKKRTGDFRVCVDFRRINALTLKPTFYIPDCNELFDCLGEAKWLSCLDLASAYYQLEVEEEHKKYTAFTTRRGQFEFNRMAFGLTGAPFTFQKLMNMVLKTENWTSCLIYLDDILIFSKTLAEHLHRTRIILGKLKEAGLKVSASKCKFFTKELSFLGHVISADGLKTDPKKVSIIKEWTRPTTVEEMRRFLGFCNYYRRYIKDYSKYSSVLENLIRISCTDQNKQKKSHLKWFLEADDSFNELKTCLCNAPVLSFPRKQGKYVIDTDASFEGIGCVLSQIQDGQERVIAYGSRKLSKSELGYCITRKELLSVYYFLNHFKHYLMGQHFIVRTDHKALTWLLDWKNPKTTQYCTWIAELEQYNFTIQHRPGHLHTNADFLSRIHSNDTMQCEQCELKHPNPLKKRNVKHIEVMRNLKEPNVLNKDEIFDYYHKKMGHIGINKMTEIIERKYHWPGLSQDVKNYIHNCIPCAERKARGKQIINMSMHITARKPCEKIMIDIAGPLSNQNGYKYILVIIDIFTRFPMLIPLRKTESDTIIKALEKRWFSLFGFPEEIISDGAKNFNSELFKQLENKGIRKRTSSPYHSASNGIVERLIGTVKDRIYALVKSEGCNWIECVHIVEQGLRFARQESIKKCPFEVMFGFMPKLNDPEYKSDETHAVKNNREKVRREVLDIQKSWEKDNVVNKFEIDDEVMIKVPEQKIPMLQRRFAGPAIIKEILNTKSYLVEYEGKLLRRHESHLKRFKGRKERQVSHNNRNNQGEQVDRYPRRNKQAVKRFVEGEM